MFYFVGFKGRPAKFGSRDRGMVPPYQRICPEVEPTTCIPAEPVTDGTEPEVFWTVFRVDVPITRRLLDFMVEVSGGTPGTDPSGYWATQFEALGGDQAFTQAVVDKLNPALVGVTAFCLEPSDISVTVVAGDGGSFAAGLDIIFAIDPSQFEESLTEAEAKNLVTSALSAVGIEFGNGEQIPSISNVVCESSAFDWLNYWAANGDFGSLWGGTGNRPECIETVCDDATNTCTQFATCDGSSPRCQVDGTAAPLVDYAVDNELLGNTFPFSPVCFNDRDLCKSSNMTSNTWGLDMAILNSAGEVLARGSKQVVVQSTNTDGPGYLGLSPVFLVVAALLLVALVAGAIVGVVVYKKKHNTHQLLEEDELEEGVWKVAKKNNLEARGRVNTVLQ